MSILGTSRGDSFSSHPCSFFTVSPTQPCVLSTVYTIYFPRRSGQNCTVFRWMAAHSGVTKCYLVGIIIPSKIVRFWPKLRKILIFCTMLAKPSKFWHSKKSVLFWLSFTIEHTFGFRCCYFDLLFFIICFHVSFVVHINNAAKFGFSLKVRHLRQNWGSAKIIPAGQNYHDSEKTAR